MGVFAFFCLQKMRAFASKEKLEEQAIACDMHNDVSFLIDDQMVLLEQ